MHIAAAAPRCCPEVRVCNDILRDGYDVRNARNRRVHDAYGT